MILEMNISYLADEIERQKERLQVIQKFIEGTKSQVVQRKVIKGKSYFYSKYKHKGKTVSKYLGKDEGIAEGLRVEFQEERERKLQARDELKNIRVTIQAMEKQLKIAEKAYEAVS